VNIAAFGERHARALTFLAAAVVLAGLLVASRLPVSLFPSVGFPRVQIIADVGDRPADRMMVEVTRVLEEAVGTVPGLVTVRSVTGRGSCDISLNFRWGIDMDTTLALVQGAVEQVRRSLPADTQIELRRMDPTVFPVIAYSLTGSRTDPVALRDLALYRLRPLLVQVPGVSQVAVLGGQVREYAVDVEPDRLLAHGVTLAEVRDAIARTNEIDSVGRLEQDYRLYLVIATGRFLDASAIGRTVVKSVDGTPITVADVARVNASVEPQWIRVTANGEPAVLVNVYQQRDASTVSIAHGIQEVLTAYRAKLPPDVSLAAYYDQSELIVSSVHSVRDSIIVGIVLGIMVLFAFLRNWRVTAIAAASVPVSIGATLLVLEGFHNGLNIMTLGGIAASVGLILDDAIVMIENVMRHVHAATGETSRAIEAAVREMVRPVLTSSFCSIVVFVPLAFLTGVTGSFFASLSLTVVAALVASLAFSLFVVPPLATRLLGATRVEQAREPAEGGRFDTAYVKIMERLLARPSLVLVAVAIAALASWGIYRQLESGFLPEMDEGAFVLDYFTLPGASLDESSATLARVERILRETPDVETYSLRTGTQLGGGITEPNQGDFLVKLRRGKRRPIAEVIDGVRHTIATSVPGIQVDFLQLMEDLIGDLTAVPQPVEIKIFGADLVRTQATARRIAGELAHVEGVVDIFDGIRIAGPTMNVVVDPWRAGRFGISTRDVDDVVGTALAGRAETNILFDEKLIGVRVRYAGAAHAQERDLLATRVPLPAGDSVPVGAIADVHVEPGTTEIARENLQQMVAVTARIEGSDLGGTVARIQKHLADTVRIPPDQDITYGGLYREQQASFRGLLVVLVAAVALVFLVLLFAFESYRAPLVVLAVDVMSLLGVLGLLWVTNTPLNMSSLMGMIMIVGIVAENAVFLLFYAEQYASDQPMNAALIEAGRVRARPIVMTTLAAVLALLPLALGIGAGAQMQRPLAIAVIGGFSLSVPLLLVCLPPLYALGGRSTRRPASGRPLPPDEWN
jgi:CzcA family heavy metal efflux pump